MDPRWRSLNAVRKEGCNGSHHICEIKRDKKQVKPRRGSADRTEHGQTMGNSVKHREVLQMPAPPGYDVVSCSRKLSTNGDITYLRPLKIHSDARQAI